MLSRLFKKSEKSEPKHYTNVAILPEEAINITRSYFESLGLDYQVSYGNPPEICNSFLFNPEEDESDSIEGEYKIPVSLKDKDGTEIIYDFFVNSQNGEIRESSASEFTKKELESFMDIEREHYLIVRTKDGQSAKDIAEKVYSDLNVKSVVVWNNAGMQNINRSARAVVSRAIHGMGITQGPILVKDKDKKE